MPGFVQAVGCAGRMHPSAAGTIIPAQFPQPRRQAVRHLTLTQAFGGSNPSGAANPGKTRSKGRVFSFPRPCSRFLARLGTVVASVTAITDFRPAPDARSDPSRDSPRIPLCPPGCGDAPARIQFRVAGAGRILARHRQPGHVVAAAAGHSAGLAVAGLAADRRQAGPAEAGTTQPAGRRAHCRHVDRDHRPGPDAFDDAGVGTGDGPHHDRRLAHDVGHAAGHTCRLPGRVAVHRFRDRTPYHAGDHAVVPAVHGLVPAGARCPGAFFVRQGPRPEPAAGAGGADRPGDRPGDPAAVAGGGGRTPAALPPPWRGVLAADDRHRRVQEGQRHLRPPGRRRGDPPGLAAVARRPAQRGPGRPLRR